MIYIKYLMLININSQYKFFHFHFLRLKQFYFFKNNSILPILFKNKINFIFILKKSYFKKYYYFFNYFYKLNKFIFLKCSNLILYKYLKKYINIIYSLTQININFFFLSNNLNFNMLWRLDINFFFKSLNKNNFIRFLINFFLKNNIKLVILLENNFFNLLPFFKKFNILTAGLVFFNLPSKFIDIPLYLNNLSSFNKYFFINLTYKVYLLSIHKKHINYFYNYLVLKNKNILI